MLEDKFMVEKKLLRVSCMKKYFFFLEVQNKSEVSANYRLSIRD